MTKADFVNIISNKTGVSKAETEVIVEGFIATLVDAMQRGDRVEIRGLGSFILKKRKPKKARNPGTGEEIHLPERVVPYFKPSKLLKKGIVVGVNDIGKE
ncbi:MAG: integration host factor subunit beta [Candidatus Marinimicrobia bacterium CG08_land_8_20_14_0_20_45_22]|nr:MAG: integration host factor subunit beta [Candidatus Marinimicrobia bacterium CG08_land_8_20_14_0_20_45_22]